jgi:tetratricopeptide (TPR) repeat protein
VHEREEKSWQSLDGARDREPVERLLRRGHYAAARELLKASLAGETPSLDGLHNYAVCCYKVGKFSEAIETCRRALVTFAASDRTRYLLGIVLKEAAEPDRA